jgi:O-antigen ligase
MMGKTACGILPGSGTDSSGWTINDLVESKNCTIFFILLYLWVLITHPQVRFPILGEIHFERILMLVCWMVLLFSSKAKVRVSRMTLLILMFYLWMIIGYLLSPYQDFFLSQHWIENYWKFIVLYFLIFFSINGKKDIFYLFTGTVCILFIYQAQSWYDFLQGGCYVWQQGMKRIVGIWTGGLGAANYFGLITLLSLPFAVFWYRTTQNIKTKVFLAAYFIMSFFSIIYSGTRGATLSFIFFLLINITSWRNIKKVAVFFVILTLSACLLPDYLHHRYFDTIPWISKQETQMESSSDETARNSALARWKGIVDGWKLAKQRPIFGYGPGASPIARKKVNVELRESDEYGQVHNLYGQLLSETGFVGTIIFLVTIFTYFYQLRSMKDITEEKSGLYSYKLALRNSMLLLLFYGIASHILFRYYWFVLFACHGAFVDIVSTTLNGKLVDTNDNL